MKTTRDSAKIEKFAEGMIDEMERHEYKGLVTDAPDEDVMLFMELNVHGVVWLLNKYRKLSERLGLRMRLKERLMSELIDIANYCMILYSKLDDEENND